MITDLDSIIAVSKLPKKDYKEKSISDELEAIISERTVKYSKDKNILPLFKEDQKEYTSQVIMPIISASGDCIGSIVVVSKDKDTIAESEEKSLKIAANFLGKQVQ